jgi:hypothetical protein
VSRRGGPRTLGGWVVRNHGIRKAWHVQRVLMAWGFCREALGEPPASMDAVCAWSAQEGFASRATLDRDAVVFREVFGSEVRIGDMYERMRRAAAEVAPEEQFYRAPASVRLA